MFQHRHATEWLKITEDGCAVSKLHFFYDGLVHVIM